MYGCDAHRCDLRFVTLDQDAKGFASKTLHEDCPISPTLSHWESQSQVREDSATGRLLPPRGRARDSDHLAPADARAEWLVPAGEARGGLPVEARSDRWLVLAMSASRSPIGPAVAAGWVMG